MSRGKFAAVLSLLCALFCAFAAQSASAAQGTTAYTCSSGASMKEFSEEHCDKGVGEAEATYGHIELGLNEQREVEVVNGKTKNETKESTPAVLKGTIAGVAAEITCTTVSGSAKITNKEITGVMQNEGTGVAIKYSACTVNKPVKCKVKEPIEMKGSSITVENLGAGKNEMGVEFKPEAGKPLATVTFEGAECGLKGVAVEVTGTLMGTGSRGNTEKNSSSGATLLFTNEMSKETLKLAGKAAELSSTVTVSMKEAGGKPITLATVSNSKGECPTKPEWQEEECQLVPTEAELEAKFKQEEECPKFKAGEKSAHDPIVFVHGWNGGIGSFKLMRKTFKEAGWPESWLCNYNYRWWLENKTSAERIKERVETILKETGAEKVDLITHSMGALSSRYYIKELGGAEKVRQWVSLGGANHGTIWASFCGYKSCAEMVPGSTFLTKLNAVETPAKPQYGAWRSEVAGGGPCDLVILPPDSAELGGTADNKTTTCLGHGALHQDKPVFEEVKEFVE